MFRGSFIIILYLLTVTSESAEQTMDLRNVIIDTQHTYCLSSSPCPWLGNTLLNISSLNRIWQNQILLEQTSCCKACSCESATCPTAGDCCPETFITYETLSKASTLQKSFCVPLQLKPRSSFNDNKVYPNTRNSIVIITKCPERNIGNGFTFSRRKWDELKLKCENENIDDVYTKIPVTYGPTQTTFRNKYCAECYGYQDKVLEYWNLQIACYGSTFKPISMDKVVPMVLKKEECNIFYYNKEVLPKLELCNVLISACNVSGKWATYDPAIEAACSAYSAPYLERYRNIFCYMCNGNKINRYTCLMGNQWDLFQTTLTFSMVMKYKETEEGNRHDIFEEIDREVLCPGNTLYDALQKSCIEVYCQEPKIYVNGSCINFATRVGGIGYRVFVQLTPISGNYMEDMAKAIESYFLQLFDTFGLRKFIYIFSLHIRREHSMSESKSGNYFVVYFEFYCPAHKPTDVSLMDNVYAMHKSLIKLNISGIVNPQEFSVRLEYFDVLGNTTTNISLIKWGPIYHKCFTLETYKGRDYDKKYFSGRDMFNKEEIRHLLPTYNCPLVSLSSSYYGIHQFPWGVSFDRSSTKLNKTEYIAKHDINGSIDISVCKHTFDLIKENALESMASATHEVNNAFLLLCLQLCATFAIYLF